MTFPRTATALREALEARGIRPRRRHGQNFLCDPQAVDAIVRDADVRPSDRVLEVGTGAGLLTHVLAETGAEVVSFEVDEDILEIARELRTWPDRVTFVPGDVLATKHELAPAFRAALRARPASPGRLLLVSNLPYGAGTPILLGVLADECPPDALVVMLQREVAEKLLAGPGTKAYGAPSVIVGLNAVGEPLRRFGPEVFWPRPRVNSAVIRLVPRADRLVKPAEQRPFGAFVTALFSHRRKVLPRAMAMGMPDLAVDRAHAVVAAAGLGADVRVERVEPEALLDLWRAALARP
jgi:16S rRNA (adenine1518-N6/adenine1519-N6)-dimethyltransferase